MAAFLDGVISLYATGGQMGPPRVNFQHLENLVDVGGLAQGCALSIALQAVVIAHAMARYPRVDGTVVATAHDDIWIMSRAAGVPPPLPPCDYGGSYNSLKAQSSATGLPIATFGRPISHHAVWAATRWFAKFERRIRALEDLARSKLDLAILAMHKLGGPGASAAYWLRGCCESDVDDPAVVKVLTNADSLWTRLVAYLAVSRHEEVSAGLSAKVFGAQSALGHVSTAEKNMVAAGGIASSFRSARDYAMRWGYDTTAWPVHVGFSTSGAPTDVQKFLDDRHAQAATTCNLSRKVALNLWVSAITGRGRCTMPTSQSFPAVSSLLPSPP